MIARVEPLTTTRRLSGPFDYRVEGPVEVGSLVRMPFGHQKLDGVVVGCADSTEVPDEKLVDVTSVRGDSIPRDLVDLALWMAEEYCSTPARALALVSPPPGQGQDRVLGRADGRRRAGQRQPGARCWRGCPGPRAATSPRCAGSRSAGW